MDIWGPLAITFVDGHRYILTIVDDFFQHTWVFLWKLNQKYRATLNLSLLWLKLNFLLMSNALGLIKDLNLICINFTLSKA